MSAASSSFVVLNNRPPVKQRKKPLIRRMLGDNTQHVRRTLQLAFAALNLYLGTQFYFFVRQYELARDAGISRPPGIEGWLPIAGMMNFKALLLTGQMPVLHPAAMLLFVTFVLSSILVRKSFCGWLCPVGTLSEYLWKTGRQTFRRNWQLPRPVDIALRSLKYILLSLFLYAVISTSVEATRAFLSSPYGLIADVKMLNFFRYLSVAGAVVIGALLILSIFIKNFWCRYLCPYGALMGLAALASPLWIRRNTERCIDCAKCAKVCPSHLPVDTNLTIRSAECLGCLECIAVCPAEGALDYSLAGRRAVSGKWVAAAISVIFLGVVGWAKISGHWDSPISSRDYQRLIPIAAELDHPR